VSATRPHPAGGDGLQLDLAGQLHRRGPGEVSRLTSPACAVLAFGGVLLRRGSGVLPTPRRGRRRGDATTSGPGSGRSWRPTRPVVGALPLPVTRSIGALPSQVTRARRHVSNTTSSASRAFPVKLRARLCSLSRCSGKASRLDVRTALPGGRGPAQGIGGTRDHGETPCTPTIHRRPSREMT